LRHEEGTFTNLHDTDLAIFSKLGISQELLVRAGIERVSDSEARRTYGIKGSGDMSGIAFPGRRTDRETFNLRGGAMNETASERGSRWWLTPFLGEEEYRVHLLS
jgi:hypothetical protein